MPVALKQIMLGGAPVSAKRYIQNGLVAMWDGIENAGWGKHDPNATTWVDLVGGVGPLMLFGNCTFPGNCLRIPNTTRSYALNTQSSVPVSLVNTSVFTIEDCFKETPRDTTSNGSFPFAICRYYDNAGNYDQRALTFDTRVQNGYGCLHYHDASWNNGAPMRTQINWSIPCTMTFLPTSHTSIQVYRNAILSTTRGGRSYRSFSAPRLGVRAVGHAFAGNTAVVLDTYNLRLYSRQLTAAEIAYNHSIDQKRFNLP